MVSEHVTDRLTEVFRGDGFHFAHPSGADVDHAVDRGAAGGAIRDAVVLTDVEAPLLVAVAVETSPLDRSELQVPGVLGGLVHKYQEKGSYEELWYGTVPVDGADAAEAAEIRYGGGDPRQALLVAARLAGPEIVTLQVHFPPSTAAANRPLALGILESLTIDRGSGGTGAGDARWDVVRPGTAFGEDTPTA